MDPYEERLREEVIYLHSLWHQGPPRPSNPNSIPVSRPANLFKKHHPNHHYGMSYRYYHPASPPRRASSLEWPVDTAPPKSPPPWPRAPKTDSVPKPDGGSPNQQAKLISGRMQWEVLATFRKFLGKIDGENDGDEDEEDDDIDDDVAGEECREYRFFLEVFVSNAHLREYFEKHHEEGEFWCFACEKNKKFKSCHALLQHAVTIPKTDRKRAHKALALVICRVLAWDIERLPVIERKGEPLSQTLLAQSALGDGNDAKSDERPDKENQVNRHGSFETLLDTDVATANGEAIEVAADTANGISGHSMEKTTGDAGQNETNGKVVEDAMDTVDNKNGGSMDNTTDDDSQVKTTDEVVENAMQVEILLETDVDTANGEVTEIAVDPMNGISGHSMEKTTGDASKNEIDGKVVEDAMDTGEDKNGGSVDKTTNDDSQIKTNDIVVDKAMNTGNAANGGSEEKSSADSQTNVDVRIAEDGGSSLPVAVAWPCTTYPKDHSDVAANGGPTLKPTSAPEEQKLAELDLQKKALEACRDFFGRTSCGAVSEDNQGGDGKSDDDNSEETEEGEEPTDTDEGSEEFDFFMKLFAENSDLKTYSESNSGDGEFYCLVCGGMGKKTRKRFRGRQGLLQHTATMLKTRQKAHRAYERALKECLGWDVNRLLILNSSRDSLDQPVVNSAVDNSSANIKLEACADDSILAPGEIDNNGKLTNDPSH